MRECHYPAWQTQKIIKGRAECMAALARFPRNQTINQISEYIKRKSSWTIFLGTRGDDYRWVDVGHGGTQNHIDAEIILENYYD